jgi:hypothetical protein
MALVAEISFVAAGSGALDREPVYMVQKPVVCLECGFTGLFMPKPELRVIKEGRAASEKMRLRSFEKSLVF